MTDLQFLLIERIRKADRAGTNALFDAWAAEFGNVHLLENVLEPTLRIIGERWQADGSFTLAQAYFAALVTEDVLNRIDSGIEAPSPCDKGPERVAVIGNVEDDLHTLGRRMTGTFLRKAGWQVYDLGCDVLPAAFVDKAVETGARVIGVSAALSASARNIWRVREQIDMRGLSGHIQLAVGGAAFYEHPELAREVGGDGIVASAKDAAHLFGQLLQRSLDTASPSHDSASEPSA